MKTRAMRAVAVAALCVLAVACNPRAPANAPSSEPSASPSPLTLKITAKGTAREPIRIVQQRDNSKQYELTAASFESSGAEGSAKAIFHAVHATFYGRDGSTLTADAPRAVVNQTANTVTLLGGVHARNSAGMALSCDQLVYTRATGMLHGTGNVAIVDPQGMRATGNRFDSNLSLTQTRMQ